MGLTDSTQTSLIHQLTPSNYIALFALLISILAIIISWLSFKRSGKISIPKVVGESTRGKNYILHIQDFSSSKNLRIDKVFVKRKNKLGYKRINFDEHRLSDQVPPIVELLLPEEIGDFIYKIILETNYKKIKYATVGFLEEPKWYDKLRKKRNK